MIKRKANEREEKTISRLDHKKSFCAKIPRLARHNTFETIEPKSIPSAIKVNHAVNIFYATPFLLTKYRLSVIKTMLMKKAIKKFPVSIPTSEAKIKPNASETFKNIKPILTSRAKIIIEHKKIINKTQSGKDKPISAKPLVTVSKKNISTSPSNSTY